MKSILIGAFLLATAHAQLRVTVYDRAGLSKGVREGTFGYLRQIFQASRIDVQFEEGDMASDEASLVTYVGFATPEQESAAACRARRDIALEILPGPTPGVKQTTLGSSSPLASKGLNVTVFDDHVREIAVQRNREHEAVLAHVIAHEIGHVLLRSSAHSGRGLMSAVWTDNEYVWMTRSLLFFTVDQSRKMLASLRGDACGARGPVVAW